jgi:hypothetical protein
MYAYAGTNVRNKIRLYKKINVDRALYIQYITVPYCIRIRIIQFNNSSLEGEHEEGIIHISILYSFLYKKICLKVIPVECTGTIIVGNVVQFASYKTL